MSKTKKQKDPLRRLVPTTAAKLRALILARDPGSQIGSLTELAELFGVGIVTLQQAARILEHEGLLLVRRGPGGGYYGTRPDEAASPGGCMIRVLFPLYIRVRKESPPGRPASAA